MGDFDFYDIEMLLNDGVDDALLRQIVAEANRFKVAQKGRLNEAFQTRGLPLLTSNRPSEWNRQIDEFVAAHFASDGNFKAGDIVVYHNVSPLAENWYKQLTGLEVKILRGWKEGDQTLYEIEIQWNRHRNVCTELNLLEKGDYDAPWWCSEVIKQRRDQLYVRLTPFCNVTKTLNDLTAFVKHMANYGARKLHVYAPHDEDRIFGMRFTIAYDSRLSFYASGKRSNRKAVISLLEEIRS